MLEKLIEAKNLIDARRYEEAKAKIEEVIEGIDSGAETMSEGKPSVGGGGLGIPPQTSK